MPHCRWELPSAGPSRRDNVQRDRHQKIAEGTEGGRRGGSKLAGDDDGAESRSDAWSFLASSFAQSFLDRNPHRWCIKLVSAVVLPKRLLCRILGLDGTFHGFSSNRLPEACRHRRRASHGRFQHRFSRSLSRRGPCVEFGKF